MVKRSYRAVLLAPAVLLACAGVASAQGTTSAGLEGDIGVKLSETSVLHVGVAAEAGYDTNVFFNDNDKAEAAILRVIPQFAITNNGRDGKARSGVVYRLGANLMYREYFSERA